MQGEKWLLNTHLGIYVGVVARVDPEEIVLDACSWIAKTGQFRNFVSTGQCEEKILLGDGVVVPRNCVRWPWRHDL